MVSFIINKKELVQSKTMFKKEIIAAAIFTLSGVEAGGLGTGDWKWTFEGAITTVEVQGDEVNGKIAVLQRANVEDPDDVKAPRSWGYVTGVPKTKYELFLADDCATDTTPITFIDKLMTNGDGNYEIFN